MLYEGTPEICTSTTAKSTGRITFMQDPLIPFHGDNAAQYHTEGLSSQINVYQTQETQ